ncbi:S8 family peptidase [Ulvibacter antarcticus]|uniref:Subtilase family protein n=1 Tax=Ulvibacter antarcticus TaxID=442714 RepID=A0A3L9Z6T0_9FLAO|nr:S8 family peptidase [Ulvibacter antarcticus]RMA67697.1 subtilase family protein [Ulvibacter antarcticus]
MSEEKFHFEIPKGNIRNVKYDKQGFAPTVQRISHSEHGKKLMTQTKEFIATEFKKKDIEYTSDLFLQIETPEKITIKSQKQKIENLGFELLSFSAKNESIGTAKIGKEKLDEFGKRLENYIASPENIGKTYFAPIESISSIPPENKIDEAINYESDESIEIVINLFNAISTKELLAITNSIEVELRQFSDNINKRNFKNGVSSLHCTIQAKYLPQIATDFSTIKEIKTSQTFFIPQALPSDTLPNPLKINPVKSDSLICIVDSGINRNGIMDNLIKDQLIYIDPSSIDCDYNHGTFVASRCVFGDDIDNCLGTHSLNPYCNLIDLSVFGVNNLGQVIGPSEFLLRTAIEDTVTKYADIVKVYNLSLGIDSPIKDTEFSDLAKLLDFLSKEYKVLFVIAAGNIRGLLGTFPIDHYANPLSRIGCPAESLLGLTIGSIAKHTNTTALSDVNFVSPFSRKGPGADNGIKPELVAHGGNFIIPYAFSSRLSTYGISKDGKNLAVDNGTSYSAPLISQYAQRLFDAYPQSDPNLVKGLLCHFTEPRNNHDELSESSLNYVGFGEPNIERALTAGDHNAAYIYEGQLDQDNYQYIGFHIPVTLRADEEDTKLRVKITVTYDPPVNPDNEKEYSEARISATLIKNTTSGMKDITISGDDKYNLPWNPIIQFEKSFSRSYLAGLWELRLRLYTRGKVNENYLQDFSVVIEIIDENEKTDVYTNVSSEFSDIYKKIEVTIAA